MSTIFAGGGGSIPEPTYAGATVRDANGRLWVRGDRGSRWKQYTPQFLANVFAAARERAAALANTEGPDMTTYYKAVRPDGTDFYTGELQWAPPEGHEAPWIVYHPSGLREAPSISPRDFLSVATVPTDCIGMAWPCRLLQVRPVDGHPVATPDRKKFPNRATATAWEVIAELDPRLALGPQADQLLALLDTVGRLTGDNLRDLAAARNAAWYAAWDAAWDAAWNAARNAAADAARNAAWEAARAAVVGAVEALVVRDCLPQEHYETLTRPWVSVIGKVHPDDEDPS